MSRDSLLISNMSVTHNHPLQMVQANEIAASNKRLSCHEQQSEFSQYLVGGIDPMATTSGSIDWVLLFAVLLVPIASLLYTATGQIHFSRWHSSSKLALHH